MGTHRTLFYSVRQVGAHRPVRNDPRVEHGNEKTTVYCIHRQGRWARTRDQACRTKEAEKSPEVLLSVNLSEASGNIRDTFFEASDLGPNF